jgi:DNA-binding transcriptional LysR family regulator
MDYNASDERNIKEAPNSAAYNCASLLYQDISTSLKQWKIFHCVVECGSFVSAAEFMGVSQATVSYAITQLEEVLGLTLLKLEGRKYKLTKPGQEMLRLSRALLSSAVSLEKYAAAFRTGRKPEIKLAVAQEFPTKIVIPTVRKLSLTPHSPKVALFELPSNDVERAMLEREVNIAISTSVPNGFDAEPLIRLEYIAVAANEHPLAQHPGPIGPEELSAHVQIMCRSGQSTGFPPASAELLGENRWQVNNVETAITAICEAVGYGWVPTFQIRDSLWRGSLKALPLNGSAKYDLEFYIVRRRDTGLAADIDRLCTSLHMALSHIRTNEG